MLRDLPLEQWPEADRQGWETALQPARRLSIGGRAAHLRPSSKANLERGYGYFLRVVSESGALNRHAAATSHVTSEAIEIFVERAELSRKLAIDSERCREGASGRAIPCAGEEFWLAQECSSAAAGEGAAAAKVFAHGRQRRTRRGGPGPDAGGPGPRTRRGASEDVS